MWKIKSNMFEQKSVELLMEQQSYSSTSKKFEHTLVKCRKIL